MNEQQAKKRIKELQGYYAHLGAFVGVNVFLIMIYLLNANGSYWFMYPLFGWGIGLLIHTFTIFAGGPNWEARKMQELTGLSQTRDEVERLAERTDRLITILASVDWSKIDPTLAETKRNLDAAREQIERLKRSDDPAGKRDVESEIERLEAFVTSPKFEYYDKAAG